MSQGEQNTAIGTTIKLEEFNKLPTGVIKAGIISNDDDGMNCRVIYSKNNFLLFRVIKHSNQDWGIYISKWNENLGLSDNLSKAEYYEDSITVEDSRLAKQLFNCSKNVMKLLIH